MILRQTKDIEIIKSVIFHPDIYPNIIEDEKLTEELLQKAIDKEDHHMLEVFGREGTLGLFYIHKLNEEEYQGHINMLPEYRGGVAYSALNKAEEWLRYNTRCCTVLTEVPKKFKNIYTFLFNANYELFDEDNSMGRFSKEIR